MSEIYKERPISEWKSPETWPLPWTSAMGLVPEIAKLGDNIIGCELGVHVGSNVVYFFENLPNIKKLIAIDPYLPYDDRVVGGVLVTQEMQNHTKWLFEENTKEYADRIELISKTSDDACSLIEDNSLDYIFIDGDHNYSAVIKDVRNYYSKVKSGGIFAGHDIQCIDIQRALIEFCGEINFDVNQVKFCANQTWYWTKP